MTDKEKLEKIRSEVIWYIHLRNEGLIIGSCGDFEKLLKFIDSIQEEPKKCMYTKDHYTDEDRKVLCDGCEEECKYAQKEKPVSEEFEKACEQLAENARKHKAETSSPFFSQTDYKQGVMDGTKWQKEHLWKTADGDDLPEYDREVIALVGLEGFFEIPPDEPVKLSYKVVFAHRPPEYWDGKDIVTGKVTRNYVKTYGIGGWNIPDVKFWLDIELPKEIEL